MKLVQPNPTNQPPKQIDQNKYLIQSDKDKNKEYEVTILETGLGTCTCPDHWFRDYKQCKHIIKVLSYIFGVDK